MAFELVVIGTSWGGLKAIEILLSGLPKDFPLAIAIAQHRHRNAGDLLSGLLQRHSPLPLVEAQDKQTIVPGWVYLAPADYHLLVEHGNFALSTERQSYIRVPQSIYYSSQLRMLILIELSV